MFFGASQLRSQKTLHFSEQIMSTDKYRSIFLHPVEAFVSFNACAYALVKISFKLLPFSSIINSIVEF